MHNDLMRRIKLLFGKATTTRITTKYVQIKMAIGTINDKIKRVHNYGFMSRPNVGSTAYTLFVGGDTSRGIAVCIEDETTEIELEPGEVAMLDDKGNLVHFKATGINITSPLDINVNGKNVNVTGEKIKLNNGKGVVTGDCICPYTGSPHPDYSSKVTAGK